MVTRAQLDKLGSKIDELAQTLGCATGDPEPPFPRPCIIVGFTRESPYTPEEERQHAAWSAWDKRNPLPPGVAPEVTIELEFS